MFDNVFGKMIRQFNKLI